MAAVTFTKGTAGTIETGAGDVSYPASVQSAWTTLHANLEATADAAAVILAPQTTTNTGFRLVPVPPRATRVLICAKYTTAGTSPTNPAGRLYGFDYYAEVASVPTFPGDDTVVPTRLDNVDNAASPITLSMVVLADRQAGDYSFTSCPSLTGYDLLGSKSIGWISTTAAALTSGTVSLLCLFLN